MPKLTKSVIDRLPLPKPNSHGQASQKIYRDDALTGFGILVGSGGTKSFFVERRINGRVKRISLGRYGHLTPAQARRKAQETLGNIAMGKDPVAERKAAIASSVTLGEAFEDYLISRSSLKPRTVANYRDCIDGPLGDWKDKRLKSITKELVEKRHRKIGASAPARANNVMRVLRAVFNHAMAKYEDDKGNAILQSNPVGRLSSTRAWYRVSRRKTLLRTHELHTWYEAVLSLNQEITRDYLLFLLYTGLRKSEATNLDWGAVDETARTITITDTKNREPHVLPITPQIDDILERRRANPHPLWVFPSPVREGRPLSEPRSAVRKIASVMNGSFALHDLRRTFITIAEAQDIPHYALKKLLNHRDYNDVTAGYIISNVDRLRGPMKVINDVIEEELIQGAVS